MVSCLFVQRYYPAWSILLLCESLGKQALRQHGQIVLLCSKRGVQGGWFAMPDPGLQAQFRDRYAGAYGSQPVPVAGLAYDGIAAIGACHTATPTRRSRPGSSKRRASGPHTARVRISSTPSIPTVGVAGGSSNKGLVPGDAA